MEKEFTDDKMNGIPKYTEVYQKKKSKMPLYLLIAFIFGAVFAIYLQTNPEVSLFSFGAVSALSGKQALQISPSASQLSLELTEYDSIEKQLYPNAPQTISITGSTTTIPLELNTVLNDEIKANYQTIDKDSCDSYKELYKDDSITKEYSCDDIKQDLAGIVELGIKTYSKGEVLEIATIDQKVLETTGQLDAGLVDTPVDGVDTILPNDTGEYPKTIINYEFDTSNLQAGDTFQIGDHSIVYTVVASASNIFNVNTTTELNNITHLTISNVAPYNNLVAYYSFDADSYTPFWVSGNGSTTNALSIDQTTKYINVPYNESHAGLNNFTVVYWMKTADSNYGTPVSRLGTGFANAEWTILGTGGTTYIDLYDTSASGYIESQKAISTLYDNKWHQVVMSWNGTASGKAILFYVDGVLQTGMNPTDAGLVNIDNTGINTTIGSQTNHISFYNGLLSQVKLYNKTLTPTEITSLFLNETQGIYGSGDRSGIVGEYSLDHTQGTNAIDNSGKSNGTLINFLITTTYDFLGNNDGTYTSGASNSPNGIYNDYASFDGTNDYINIPYSPTMQFGTNNFTISTWTKWNNPSASYAIALDTYGDGGGGGIQTMVGMGTGQAWCYLASAVELQIKSSRFINDSQWHLITCVKEYQTVKVYVDGVFNGSATNAGIGTLTNTRPFHLGWYQSPNNFAYLDMDELMIFNQSLNSSQISQIYTNQSNRFYPQGQATIKFTTLTNLSHNTINLTIGSAESNYGSNVSVRIGSWNISNGYDCNNESLVAYYHADGNANDCKGINNGVLTGGVNAGGQGIFSNGFVFNGASGYINISDSNSLDIIPELTLSAWIYYNTTTETPIFFSKRTGVSTNYQFWSEGSDSNKLYFGSNDGSWHTAFSSAGLLSNRWYLVTAVYTDADDTVKFYIDGNLDSSKAFASALTSNSGNLFIGRDGDAGSNYYKGAIDEAMIWNKSLSANEIKELYVKGRTANVGVNWTYGAYANIIAPNTNVPLSYTPYATHIIPDFLQSSTPTTNFYTPLFGGTIRLDSYQTAGAPVDSPPVVTFNTPANGTTKVNNPIYYAYNHTDDIALKNTTEYLWNASGIVATNFTTITGLANFTNLSLAFSNQGVYLFNAYTCDSINQCAWATVNRSIYYDTLAPVFSALAENPTDPSTYAQGQFYEFNVTIVEAQSSVNTAIIEFNGVNYTSATNQVLNRGNGVYTFNRTNLGAGTYNYYWYANDSAGNNNQTAMQSYTVNPTTRTITLTLDGFATNRTVLSGIAVSLNASKVDSEGVIQLITIGNIIGQGTNSVLNSTIFTGSGSKNVTAFSPATQNYTSGTLTRWVDLLSTGGSICGVASSVTRINATTIQFGASSWDSSGAKTTYTLTGLCRDSDGNTITFPTFTTLATGTYESKYVTSVGGTCEIRASGEQCIPSNVAWYSYFGNSTSTTTIVGCQLNSSALQTIKSSEPYGQLCKMLEFA